MAYFLWQHLSAPLSVTQVHVHTDRVRVGCEQTALVTALVRSEGGAGTIRYRWLRSDGNVSGVLRQSVADGEEQTVLPLRWTFHGHGTYDAVAVVEILSPTVYTSSVALTYRCS
ncbi:hypothetical protein ACFWFF_11455 [Streptomyces sp. NPDC060223]|uniref:hypothetical protein n=1 Tax=unclassified Streptomyces TaxID=2593676 RepID=UPI00362B6265